MSGPSGSVPARLAYVNLTLLYTRVGLDKVSSRVIFLPSVGNLANIDATAGSYPSAYHTGGGGSGAFVPPPSEWICQLDRGTRNTTS